ncbi:nuclear transport factor 2 family protein [Actinomadura barringtoniae]|uniref:Nuclear transport factor 2 family protein n=2 Tax=Actinomadura barringtoniae TaxID=1427535 RepID=A0A939PP44_9ACTN|nr:nuclear transport factor 2 family protein [Actinomadura barringtoniae]
MRRRWLNDESIGDLLAEDVVLETPFAPPGRPTRIEGRDRFLAIAEPQRAALPVRFEAAPVLAVHDTLDPEVIVVEYELAGTITTTGRKASAPFIGVLRARDGKIVQWREYQHTQAMAAALA